MCDEFTEKKHKCSVFEEQVDEMLNANDQKIY